MLSTFELVDWEVTVLGFWPSNFPLEVLNANHGGPIGLNPNIIFFVNGIEITLWMTCRAVGSMVPPKAKVVPPSLRPYLQQKSPFMDNIGVVEWHHLVGTFYLCKYCSMNNVLGFYQFVTSPWSLWTSGNDRRMACVSSSIRNNMTN